MSVGYPTPGYHQTANPTISTDESLTQKANRLNQLSYEIRTRIRSLDSRLWPQPEVPIANTDKIQVAMSLPAVLDEISNNLSIAMNQFDKIDQRI